MRRIYKTQKEKREYAKRWAKDNPEKVSKRNKKYRENYPEKIKEMQKKSDLKRHYGLSYKDWLRIWEDQDGKCAICRRNFSKPSDAFVDHNHETGKVRGLLCRKCNFGIGFFDDNLKLTIKATQYLMENE
ncbi:hypothetical protein ES708_09085 [subsurface metagenome]